MCTPNDQTLIHLLGRAYVVPAFSCESTSCFHKNDLREQTMKAMTDAEKGEQVQFVPKSSSVLLGY